MPLYFLVVVDLVLYFALLIIVNYFVCYYSIHHHVDDRWCLLRHSRLGAVVLPTEQNHGTSIFKLFQYLLHHHLSPHLQHSQQVLCQRCTYLHSRNWSSCYRTLSRRWELLYLPTNDHHCGNRTYPYYHCSLRAIKVVPGWSKSLRCFNPSFLPSTWHKLLYLVWDGIHC